MTGVERFVERVRRALGLDLAQKQQQRQHELLQTQNEMQAAMERLLQQLKGHR